MIDFQTQKYTFISGAVEELTGFTVDEYLSMSLEESVSSVDYHLIINEFEERTKEYYANGTLPHITHEIQLCKKNDALV
jgi:hypothetical protein